jgi:hypothetical protein
MIETESQAVLNTLTVHDFQDAFKKWQNRWERCIRTDGSTTRVMVASRPKINFDQMTAPVPEIMDSSLYVVDFSYVAEEFTAFIFRAEE